MEIQAREWGNIHIVTMKWLTKSIEMGYVQKETHYDPERVRYVRGRGKDSDEVRSF